MSEEQQSKKSDDTSDEIPSAGSTDDQLTPSQEAVKDAAEMDKFKDDFSFSTRSGLLSDNKRGIFVALGEREEINQDCLRVIQEYGIEPFIIYPNKSLLDTRSINDLLSQHPKTDFAFVLLTGDDFVYCRKDGKPATAKLKAKQEAVFLLGYLLGKFGTQSVFVLYKPQKSFIFPVGAQNANFVAYEKNGFWTQIFENRLKERGLLDTPK